MKNYLTLNLSEMVDELEKINELQKMRFSDIYESIKLRQLEETDSNQTDTDTSDHVIDEIC